MVLLAWLLEEPPFSFLQWLLQFTFPPPVHKGSPFSTPSPGGCRRRRFDLWSGKIPWRRKWQLTPIFLSEKCPWTEATSGLQSTGSQRIRHNLATEQQQWLVMLSIFSCVCWPSVCLLWKNVYSGPLPIVQLGCFFDVELHEFFLYFGY